MLAVVSGVRERVGSKVESNIESTGSRVIENLEPCVVSRVLRINSRAFEQYCTNLVAGPLSVCEYIVLLLLHWSFDLMRPTMSAAGWWRVVPLHFDRAVV